MPLGWGPENSGTGNRSTRPLNRVLRLRATCPRVPVPGMARGVTAGHPDTEGVPAPPATGRPDVHGETQCRAPQRFRAHEPEGHRRPAPHAPCRRCC